MPKVKSVIIVEGMSCSHCENAVKTAALGQCGVTLVEVDLKSKKVTIEYDNDKVLLDSIKGAIEYQGYDVI